MRATKDNRLSDPPVFVYRCWDGYVQVNHATRRCYYTEGEMWIDITREEAALRLLGKS